MKKKLLIMLSCCMLTAALCVTAASAQENDGSRVDFSVKAIIPENQTDKRLSFFDLRAEPGQTQILQVRIYNNAGSPLTADVELNTASTNPGGVIDYSRSGIKDESMKIAISELAYIEEPQIVVPPYESRIADIKITMPEEDFDGTLLGGIQIKKTADEAAAETPSGTGIINEYAYVIAVRLTGSDTPAVPELNLKKVEPALINYKTAVISTIQNSAARVMKDMDIRAEIYETGTSAPLRETSQSGVDMAPNSVLEYAVDWGNSKINPGEYLLHLTVAHGGRTWEWNEPFTIKSEEAGEVNNGAIGLEGSEWLAGAMKYFAICAAAVLLTAVVYRTAKRRKNAGRT